MSEENLDFTNKLLAWVSENIKFIVIGIIIGISPYFSMIFLKCFKNSSQRTVYLSKYVNFQIFNNFVM